MHIDKIEELDRSDFFRRLGDDTFVSSRTHGRYFVTSSKHYGQDRLYTVRMLNESNYVVAVGDEGAYKTDYEAHCMARKLNRKVRSSVMVILNPSSKNPIDNSVWEIGRGDPEEGTRIFFEDGLFKLKGKTGMMSATLSESNLNLVYGGCRESAIAHLHDLLDQLNRHRHNYAWSLVTYKDRVEVITNNYLGRDPKGFLRSDVRDDLLEDFEDAWDRRLDNVHPELVNLWKEKGFI